MEGKSPKRTRGRSKSSATESATQSGSADEEMAPNLNGNKDGGKQPDEESNENVTIKTEPPDSPELPKVASESPTRPSRKRKATEMKSEDSVEENVKEKEVTKEVTEDESTSTPVDTTNIKIEDESELSEPITDITVPEKQSLGKGKRARVPNKRYSDIIPSKVTFEPAKPKSSENGQLPESTQTDTQTPQSDTKKVVHANKKFRSQELSNPNFLKPFQYGWKRELVYRATGNDTNPLKRNGDIYYYTPTGKKVRSMREVAENLKNKELTIHDFTFFKEPIGLDDADKEIIRDAKLKNSPVVGKKMARVTKPVRVNSPRSTTASKPAPVETPKSPTKPSTFKVKVPKGSTTKMKEKKIKVETPKDDGGDMEIGTYPPTWAASPPKKGKPKKQQETPKTKSSARLRNQSAIEKVNQNPEAKFMDTYLQNLAYGYKTLLCVFQYLKVQDLLRAGCVCTMWRDVARHHLLWSTVRMKNSQIHSFDGLANALRQHGTVHLDLRKMLLPTSGGDDIWPSFTSSIKKVVSLRKIELCRCLASVVEDLALNNHNLEAINAVTIKCENMSFNPFKNLKNLTDLRLKSTAGFVLTSDLSALKELTNLKHLSITSIKDLYKLDIEVIGELVNLEVLDLGECYDFPEHFGPDILSKLVKLEKLRLEKGQGDCHTFEILEAVKELKALQQLELVNFDIKSGFDKALGGCVNIKKLLIIPTYISQSATTNHMVLGGVLKLQKTLSHFVWGVTLELLRVTELFVDQCESPDKNVINKDKNINNGDSIPVLKPVPLHGIPQPEIPPTSDTPQVEILPLPNLQKLLLQNLPTTRVKILKIPFHATWRQSITDSVN